MEKSVWYNISNIKFWHFVRWKNKIKQIWEVSFLFRILTTLLWNFVFPLIVVATTILFWICRLKRISNSCRNTCKFTYIRHFFSATTIQGRKLFAEIRYVLSIILNVQMNLYWLLGVGILRIYLPTKIWVENCVDKNEKNRHETEPQERCSNWNNFKKWINILAFEKPSTIIVLSTYLLGANKRVHSISIFIFFPHPIRLLGTFFLELYTSSPTRLENFQKIFHPYSFKKFL